MTTAATCLVIGAGGTGKSFLLRRLIADVVASLGMSADSVTILAGHPARPVSSERMQAMLDDEPPVLALDDLHWFDDEALALVADASDSIAVVATRRPWPSRPAIRLLDDVLARERQPQRVGMAGIDDFAAAASAIAGRSMATTMVADLHTVTAGSIGLLSDVMASGWQGSVETLENADLPPTLVDAVMARVERSGSDAMELMSLLALQPDLEISVASNALPDHIDSDGAERALRAGGLLDDAGRPIPLVVRALRTHLTSRQRAALHDRLAAIVSASMPDAGIDHLLAGTGRDAIAVDVLIDAVRRTGTTDPERTLHLVRQAADVGIERPELRLAEAEAAYWLGLPDSLDLRRAIDGLSPEDRAAHALLGFGSDVRDLRWASASARRIPGSLGDALHQLSDACLGVFTREPPLEDTAPGEVQHADERLIRTLVSGMRLIAIGEGAEGLAIMAQVADDVDRMHWAMPLGITPHFLAAAAALSLGDLSAAESLLVQARETGVGGPGEARSHELLLASVRLSAADFAPAIALVREGDEPTWPQRDRLLLASLDAALARRSGDTARLREAWARTETVLVRPSASWLLTDHVIELLAAGARIGDERRVVPVEQALTEQLLQMPSAGVGPVSGRWMQLQIAIAREDALAVKGAAKDLEALPQGARPTDARRQARIQAAGVWSSLMDRDVDEERSTIVSTMLADAGDRWEASRILGQSALDHHSPEAARRLLEAARNISNDVADAEAGDGLITLGLSEREAEVARLVSDGRTYKEVGAQLYISPKTVEHHVANVRQKLGASSRAEMIAIVRGAAEPDR